MIPISNEPVLRPWYSSLTRSDFVLRVQEAVREALSMTQQVFTRLWNQAAAAHQWRLSSPLTAEFWQEILRSLQSTLVYHGPGCCFEWPSSSNSHVHGLVNYLLGKQLFSREWVNLEILKAIFWKKNPEILRCMRQEFKNALEECTRHIPEVGSPEEILFQTFVSNCLALLPYSYPEEGEEFIVPQKIEGEWRVCRYVADSPIALTPAGLISPIYAFGMVSAEGPPLLCAIGTTYPAVDGFLATLMADATPGLSVGHAPYWLGQDKLRAWLAGKENVRLFGMSLGGAICFHVLRKFREKIAEVDVHNPAGLYPWNWQEPFDEERVNIYYQENDLVATMGYFPTGRGVTVYRVYGPQAEHFGLAHARSYSGCPETTILKSSPEYENGRCIRQFLTVLHFTVSLAIGIFWMLSAAFFSYRATRLLR